MARLRVKLLGADQAPLNAIEGWTSINGNPGVDEWRGRLWLPDDDQVNPTRKYCPIRTDVRAGEMITEQFVASESA
jgi:hypothetical protein